MKGKFKTTIFMVITILSLIAISSAFLVKNSTFVSKNEKLLKLDAENAIYYAKIKTKNGDFGIDSLDIIKKSSQLLGKEYGLDSKGVGKYITNKIEASDVKSANNITSIDCSGLIYWTLSSIAIDMDKDYGTETTGFGNKMNFLSSNISSGFSFNNPVPANTYHWLTYYSGNTGIYFKEAQPTGKDTTGIKSVNEVDLKIFGKSVNVLKANQPITSDLAYYEYYEEGSTEKKTLPAGTIVIANNNQLNHLGEGIYDHAWICIGDLGTTDAKVAKEKLIAMGLDSEKLIINEQDKSKSTIYSVDDKNTYWRIESNGANGVCINNSTAEESIHHGNVTKKSGPIWAFQIANDEKGQYNVSVEKVDENGNAIALSNNIFEVKVNENTLNGNVSKRINNRVEFDTQYFEGSDIKDDKKNIEIITIKEKTAPNGYNKYENIIQLKVRKVRKTKPTGEVILTADPIELKILTSDGKTVLEEYDQSKLTAEKFQYGDHNVHLDFSYGTIIIKIKNRKLGGNYNLNILKTDSAGKSIKGSDFDVKLNVKTEENLGNTWNSLKLNGKDDNSDNAGIFTAEPITISNIKTTDVIRIIETKSPAGHEKLDKEIVLQIKKKEQNSKYIIESIGVSVLNKGAQITSSAIGDGTYIINPSNRIYENSENHFKIELSEDYTTINVTVENRKVDLALKKTITKVAGKEVTYANGFNVERVWDKTGVDSAKYDQNNVDTSSLKNTTNAKYMMNKKPVAVNIGDEVEYSIKIFNEGEVKAKASKINDYIPQGLRVTGVKYHNSDIAYNVVKGVLSINLDDNNFIEAYNADSKKLSYDEVIVTCVVESDASGVLTNVAEITEYKTPTGVLEKDIDSTSNDWNAPKGESKLNNAKNSSSWRNYGEDSIITSWSEYNYVQDSGVNGNKGDDDDFDKLIVNNIDLALKKVITQVATLDENGNVASTQTIKRPNTNDFSWVDIAPLNNNKTDALYNMNKTPILLKRGNEVSYRLYIFNEGQTDAKALDITDYIPVGLEVKDVFYKDNNAITKIEGADLENNALLEANSNSNYYGYAKNNGVLSIHLGATDIIPAFNGTTLSQDYVTVTCIVKDDAEGILTNMAEISTYATKNTTVNKDIDSISNNWKSPTNESKTTADKSKSIWRMYTKGTGELDDKYHQTFIGKKYDNTNGQEDDDDFEKVKVLNDYKVAIQKISSQDEEQSIENIGFSVQYKNDKPENKYTNSEGKIDVAEKIVSYTINADEEDVFYIQETTIPEGVTYSKINTKFELRIKKVRTANGSDTIEKYAFVVANSNSNQIKYKALPEETILTVNDADGNPVNVRVKYNSEVKTFIITIPNNAEGKSYEFQLIKVKNKISETDVEEGIEGIEFSNSASGGQLKTDANGRIEFGEFPIDLQTYENNDEFVISEVEDSQSRYYQLAKPITVKVKKGLNVKKANFFVEGISLNGSDFSKGPITEVVSLKNSSKKVTIELSLQGNVITLKVPNILKDGKYSLAVIKQDKNGDILETEQAGFSLTDENDEVLTVNGRAQLISDKPISADELGDAGKDSYVISEITVPEGYVKLAKPIKLDVYKADNGENFIVSKVYAYVEGGSAVTVDVNKFGWLNNVELIDGTKVNVCIDLQKSNMIEVFIPNNALQGKFNIEVYKYSMENGIEIKVPNINFSIIKTESIKASTRATDAEGIAYFRKITINNESVDTYELREGKLNSDSKYIGIAEAIKFTTVTGKSSDGSRYELLDANFENGTKETAVSLENGEKVTLQLQFIQNTDGINVIRFNIENPPITGRYMVKLVKIVDKVAHNTEYLKGVIFNVKENGATEAVPYETAEDGKVKIADKIITYNDANTVDEYIIDEIKFANNNKYVKLKYPLTLRVEKDKNKYGEIGTKDAPGTKFVISKIQLIGQSNSMRMSSTKSISSTEDTVTITNIALENGSLVDVVAKLTEEIDNATGEKIQLIELTIPNVERNGNYEVKLRKIDASGANVSNAEFKVESTINGVVKPIKTTERTVNGYVSLESVTLDADTLETIDTFKISEVNIYKNANGNEVQVGYAKLAKPVTLSITKGVSGDKFVVSKMSLSQEGKETVTSTNGIVTLKNADLEYNHSANITAKLEDNVMTVTIPNNEISGNYSLDLIKTRDNFTQTMQNAVFKYTGNKAGKKTDENGQIVIVDSYNITKSNVEIVDNYEITEVEDQKNNFLELAESINISVEKDKVEDEFAVTKITMLAAGISKSIVVGGEHTVQIDGIRTVKNGTTTSARLSYDEASHKITVYVENPRIDGEYSLKIKKVDSNNNANVLEGVKFKSIQRKIKTTGGPYEVIKEIDSTTQADGYAYILGDNPYTTQVEENEKMDDGKPEIWNITEISTLDDYQLLDKVTVRLTINKKLSNDGKQYIIDADKLELSVTANDSSDEAYAMRTKLLNGIEKSVSEDGKEITIILPNEKLADYGFKLMKTDESGNPLPGAVFTVVDANGDTLLNEQTLPNDGGTSFVKNYNNVKPNSTYKFEVIENESQNTYNNLLAGFKLQVSVKLNEHGNVDIAKSEIEVIPLSDDYNRDSYINLRELIESKKIKLSLEDNNTIGLTIINEKIKTDYSLNLVKTEIDHKSSLSGAEFSVTKNGSELISFTTVKNSPSVIDSPTNVEANTEIEYEVQETRAPANYFMELSKARIIVNVDDDGNVTAKISKILPIGSSSNWVDYEGSTYENIVKLERKEGTNEYSLKWANNARFAFILLKEGYTKTSMYPNYNSNLIASSTGAAILPLISGANISIAEDDKPEQIYTDSPSTLIHSEIKANSEYVYTIKELSSVVNYRNDFEGVELRVHIRTDENAKLVKENQERKHQSSYYEIIDLTGTKTSEQIADIESKIALMVDSESKTVKFFMVNTACPANSNYNLIVFKEDELTRKKLEGAEFRITHNDGTTNTMLDSDPETEGIQNFTTDKGGKININDIPFELLSSNQIHTFTIEEVKAPTGYKGLGDAVVTVSVDLSNKANASQITSDDITVNVSDGDSTKIKKHVYDGGDIALTIPNIGKAFKVTLRKIDTNNDLIKASYINNEKQATKLSFKVASSGYVIANANQYFDEGEVTYNQNIIDNTVETYSYIISEVAAKYGYANIFEGVIISLNVKLDSNGDVLDVNPDDITDENYTHVKIFKYVSSSSITIDDIKQFVKLRVVTEIDGTKRVVIELINPNEYKLRLRKTDTNGNALDKAKVKAYLVKNGVELEKAELDGTSENTTDAITIKNGETQSWVIDELEVEKPYCNILDGDKKLYITSKMEDNKLLYDYEVHDIIDGNKVVLGKTNEIYEHIKVNVLLENDGYVLDVQIKNPSGLDFKLIKADMKDTPINSSAIKVNEITNINGTKYDSQININERNLKIGEEKTYVISELTAKEPYVNVLGNSKLIVRAKVVTPKEVRISGIGYIDESNVTHNGTFGPYSEFITVPSKLPINSTTKMPTMVLYLRNPIKYKVRLYKVDDNDKTIKNADFQLVDQNNNIYRNENSDFIEITSETTKTNDVSFFKIKENASALGYNNDLKDWDIYFKGSFSTDIATLGNPTVKVSEPYMKNRITGDIILNKNVLNKYFTYEVIKEDNIPVIIVKIKNTTDYTLNVVKQTTNGIEYNGAELELYQVDADTKTLLANNIVDGEKQANITLNDISVVPNKVYTYSIKENSTEAPHVNILGDNKEVRLNVKLLKDEDTSSLSFDYNYDILDGSGNVIPNDIARDFISFELVQNETTGKYTLNMYIQNPIQMKMKFRKTDMDGNEILNKAVIAINDVENNGSKDETYSNLKVGDIIRFSIRETTVDAPFVNVLPNNSTIVIVARVMEDEKIGVIHSAFVDLSTGEVINKHLSEISEYFSMNITEEEGIETLDLQLKNPMEYKVKILKKDMAGFGLEGADIVARYNGETYSNEGRDFIEIPITKQAKGDIATIFIKENESKENYKNVFGSNNIVEVQFIVNDDYTIDNIERVYEIHTVGKVPIIRVSPPGEYFDVKIDNMINNSAEITAEIIMKNPIEYDIEFVKEDLSGNEISGDGLRLQVTRNSDAPVLNEGKSTIKFSETKLAPNTVNTYVIEELSTIAPHINELKGKKATIEVRVDSDGNIIASTPVITDDSGKIYENKVVFVEPNVDANNGKKTVKVVIKNPMTYRFKLTKTTTPVQIYGVDDEPIKKPIDGVSIQVNDISNDEGTSQIDMNVNDVKVGDTKLFVIKENYTPAPYENLLQNKEIRLITRMGADRKLHFVSEVLKDTVTGESALITNEIKEKYRFDYEFVDGSDGIETLEVNIQNPIKFNLKIVKKDATGVTELSGTDIELRKNNEVIGSNKETGSAVIEYTEHDVGSSETYTYVITENSSVSPNQNILSGKRIIMPVSFSKGNLVQYRPWVIESETGVIDRDFEFMNVRLETIDNVKNIIIELTNPVDYDLDLVKNAAGVGFLNNTKFKVYREDLDEAVFDGYVEDINTWKTSEVQEHNMKAGRYTYYITETKTARQRYINILDGKYIKVNVEISGTGKVTIMNNNWQEDSTYFEVYKGDIENRKNTDELVVRTDDIYNDVNVNTIINKNTGKYIIQCNVINPLKYQIELEKFDTAGETLSGAKFEVVSSIIDNQNAEKTEMDKTVGVQNVAEDGTVSGVTDSKGKISFEENHVYAGTYEYELKETQTPGKQYVNPIEGYTVHFKVNVEENGNLKLEFYENGKKCYIEKDGEEAPEELYNYVYLATLNNRIIAKLQIQVENPVKFKVNLHKQIYGDENIFLGNADFKIESGIVKAQKASYRKISEETGITNVTEDGVILATTNVNGNISYTETMVKAGTYEYWITEIKNGNNYIINPLKDKYIKVYVKVDNDGTLHTITEDGQIIDGKFYLFEKDKTTKIDPKESSLDELITVEVNEKAGLNVLNIKIDNPEFYEFSLVKIDKDTNEKMDEVEFAINTYEEGAEGVKVPVDIKCAEEITKHYDTSKLVTGVVSEEHGTIKIDGILIEKAGTYYYEFVEKTPKDEIIYKDKAENIIVKVVIDVEEINGQKQYVVKEKEVVQGKKYVINSSSDKNTVEIQVSNERVKGSYNIQIVKLEELLGRPVTGAKFAVKAFKENKELGIEDECELYKSTDNVNSKEVIIPTEFTINNENGEFVIEGIRIERPETYTIEIEEIEAPENYTLLRDVIRLKVTTGIDGENDDAKYVLESVKLDGNDNDGLVKVSNTKDKIIIEATNNQFDLSLRKFISSINGKDVTRWTKPQVDTSKLVTGEETTAEYYNSKIPLRIYAGQEIIYTLRVYNEGQIAGYATTIVDHLPEQLEFLPDDEFNTSRRWTYVESDLSKRTIQTDYLSKYVGKEVNLIKPFDTESGKLDYVEVQVKCKVKDNVKARTYITNIAEITEYEGENRPNVVDRDNSKLAPIPSDEDLSEYKQDKINDKYVPGNEDDDDFEKVIVEEFDLSLRKFITQVNDKAITSRVPVFKVDENGNYYYDHDKTPLIVAHDNLVEYTLRVYNEGTVSGYANLVKDDIPEGLVFVPNNETNKEYKWVMLDADGKETNDVTKAKYVSTDYLSKENGEVKLDKSENAESELIEKDENKLDREDEKEIDNKENEEVNPNLIKAFDEKTMKEPDSRDLKVVFRVNVPVRRDDVIVNEAQISDDRDESGDEVEDKDSTPDKWIKGEDDQDVEYIKVKYFDLALYKWVSTSIVTQDGKTTEYESKHTHDDKANMVNVSIPKNKVNDVTVKFRYVIRVENQGNLAGYAKEIKDHIPAGLKFISEDNTEYGWVDNGDGTIVTDYLKDTLLNEGETAEVPVTLTWINGSDNLGQKFNYAEISKDYNDYGSPDVDSETDNFKDTPREDDEDGDVVMLQIRTGISVPSYVFVGLAAVMIVVIGVVGIKKFVLSEE